MKAHTKIRRGDFQNETIRLEFNGWLECQCFPRSFLASPDYEGASYTKIIAPVPWNPSRRPPGLNFLSLWKMDIQGITPEGARPRMLSLTGIDDEERARSRLYIGQPPRRDRENHRTPSSCPTGPGNFPTRDLSAKPLMERVGNDVSNARFNQQGRGLRRQSTQLKVKWPRLPGRRRSLRSATSQRRRVFLGGIPRQFIPSTQRTGCVYWSYQADSRRADRHHASAP